MEKMTEFLVQIVKEAAGLITPEFEIKAKGEFGDLVTNFDLEIESYLIKKMNKQYPKFDIVSEETNSQKTLTQNCFVIDPIDGTVNFAHGLPLWGIQVASVENGETTASVLYLPRLNELYYADKSGAFLNDQKIVVKDWKINHACFAIDGGNKAPSFVRLFQATRHVRVCAAQCVNLAWTACGRLSGAVFKNDSPWDYLPGQYLVKQAGGYIIDEKGCHIAASCKEFADLLKKECGPYKNDIAITKHD